MDPWTAIWSLDPQSPELNLTRLLGLNNTQADLLRSYYFNQTQAVDDAELHMFVYNVIPFLLETFALGAVSIVALLLVYTRLREQSSWKRTIIPVLCAGVCATHWMLEYRAIELFSPITFSIGNGIVDMKEVMCETALFGVLTGLVCLASALLIKARNTSSRSRWTLSRCLPFGIVIVMYTAAAAHWSLAIWAYLHSGNTSQLDFYGVSAASAATLSLSVIGSDAIVLWRACAVWMNGRGIVLLSAFLILATTASSFANVALLAKESLGDLSDFGVVVFASPARSLLTTPGLISLGISIFTNGFATLAISYKAWKHRAMVRKHLTTGSRRLITEKIMCIFVESGAVYICLWILYAVATISLRVDDVSIALDPYAYSMVQITAIYPTLIIILVFLETKAHYTRNLNVSAQLPAAHATIVTMIHSMPSDVLDIGPEGVDAEQVKSEGTASWESDDISCESKDDDGRSL